MKQTLTRILRNRWFLIGAGLLVAYALFGFLLLPWLVQRYLPEYARDSLQRQASIGKVRINPFLFTFEANDLRLAESDGNPDRGRAAPVRRFRDRQPAALGVGVREHRHRRPRSEPGDPPGRAAEPDAAGRGRARRQAARAEEGRRSAGANGAAPCRAERGPGELHRPLRPHPGKRDADAGQPRVRRRVHASGAQGPVHDSGAPSRAAARCAGAAKSPCGRSRPKAC